MTQSEQAMTDSAQRLESVARAICKSRTCEGVSCCQWPAQRGRTDCPVKRGAYDDAARDAIAALRSSALPETGEKTPFLMLSCREARRCLHLAAGCICELDPTQLDIVGPLRNAIALEIWHRFADSGVEEWEEETHKAEYLMCADAILALRPSPDGAVRRKDLIDIFHRYRRGEIKSADDAADLALSQPPQADGREWRPSVQIKPRRPFEDHRPDGMLESDRDFMENNREACIELLERYSSHPQSDDANRGTEHSRAERGVRMGDADCVTGGDE